MKDIPDCSWLDTWIKLTMEYAFVLQNIFLSVYQLTSFVFFRFAFQHNPPLQARAVIVYGCVCKEIDDAQIRQLLLVFIKVKTNIYVVDNDYHIPKTN